MTIDEFKKQLKNNPFLILSDHVYQYILEAIVDAQYMPSTKINSKKISEDLGISRTPIRAALIRLSEEGIVEPVGEKGFRVSPIDWSDCLSLYDVRLMIEGSSAYIAANTISQEYLDRLLYSINLLSKAKREHDDELSFIADNMFHDTIVRATENDYLISMHDSLKISLRRYQNALRITEKYHIDYDNHILDKHTVIYKAIKNSYSSVAQNEMEDHLRYIYRILFQDKGEHLKRLLKSDKGDDRI